MSTKAKPAKIPKTDVVAIRHKDQRTNIPTEELRGFVSDEEKAPVRMLYPRDPSLDPQLVWKGKDEQDAKDLAVPVVPIYIQEKIHPQALIEDLRAHRDESDPSPQPSLFADFNGIRFEDSIDFYHHGQNWSNRMILGDSLLAMASLAEKESLKGRVQMIYMDPPYGIKFNSNWQVSTRKREVRDGKSEDLTRQPEQIRAFRDTWQLGVHSYLAYMRDRFAVAHDLLTPSGSVFIQIGDENLHLVRSLLDEVFGAANFVSQITLQKAGSTFSQYLGGIADFILWYAKDRNSLKYRELFRQRDVGNEEFGRFSIAQIDFATRVPVTELNRTPTLDELVAPDPLQSASAGREKGEGAASWFPVSIAGQEFRPTMQSRWKTNQTGMARLLKADRVIVQKESIRYARRFKDFSVSVLTNIWCDLAGAVDKLYVVQTSPRAVERCLLLSTDPGDLVLDPTCGSGTTAYVAEQWGRRWITIDTSRVALTLARTRVMAGRYPYFLLKDSPEGRYKEAEVTGLPPAPKTVTAGDVKKGFVYRRVPHVTLESIAKNEEIDVIHTKYEERLQPVLAKLNAALRFKWREWEVPREADAKWSAAVQATHHTWWELRLARQKEIDDSIARRANTEFLLDLPFDDPKRIRVSGPFTVESLSPHRVLAPDDAERPTTERNGEQQDSAGGFVNVILENLRKAGVRGTDKSQAIRFDRLDPFAGTAIQAAGEYTSPKGKQQRVAVAVGPQYGTVGPDLIRESAKEAVQGIGYDLLIVCGFAFDPHVCEEVKQYGKLTVQVVRMNPDLLMGEDLLKKTGAGQLFTVFGEPDVDIRKRKDGKLEVEIRGVDVYDPTTQEIRSRSTEDIACWLIDTEYSGESFFVRHAYFTGAGDPYEKLRRALKAEVDELAWASLYATVSRPFDRPKTGKIAIKVINHFGDEVLKVFAV